MAALIGACRPTQLPGESQGQYRVTGTLVENTCGDGHPAPPNFTFYVELRAERGTRGYWKLPAGPAVDGTMSHGGAFRFEQRTQHLGVAEDLPNGVVGCSVERLEVVAGELSRGGPSDGGVPDGGMADAGASNDGGDEGEMTAPALRATTTVTVTPVVGGDCSPLLLPNGGAFPALPCELRWDLAGERLAEPLW